MVNKIKLKYLGKDGFDFKFEEIESGKEVKLKIWKDKSFKDTLKEGNEYFAVINGNWINELESIEVESEPKVEVETIDVTQEEREPSIVVNNELVIDNRKVKPRPITQAVPRSNRSNTKSTKDFMVKIGGKEFITYEGLLHLAHKKGLISMDITDHHVDFDKESAWCMVVVRFKDESFFEGFGSSTPKNTGAMVRSHFVEMSHTRAKARALRDALDIGVASVEELGD